jgi:hypothetical protein
MGEAGAGAQGNRSGARKKNQPPVVVIARPTNDLTAWRFSRGIAQPGVG